MEKEDVRVDRRRDMGKTILKSAQGFTFPAQLELKKGKGEKGVVAKPSVVLRRATR